MSRARPTIALLVLGGGEESQMAAISSRFDAIGGAVVPLSVSDALPGNADGLCVAGEASIEMNGTSMPEALSQAANGEIPILGVEAGFHALNLVFGGQTPIALDGHTGPNGEPVRHQIFMGLGGKLADAIGGAGFVTVSAAHSYSVTGAQQAPDLMASAHATDDGAIEALELPGPRWVLGVQWREFELSEQPRGFDNLLHALIGIAAEGGLD
jgi:gamma-glutamyl-gamma-aminobutyrate hydrolase PuuD